MTGENLADRIDLVEVPRALAEALGLLVHTWSDFEARLADLFVSVLRPANYRTGYVVFYSIGNLQPRLKAVTDLIRSEREHRKGHLAQAEKTWKLVRDAAVKLTSRRNGVVHGMVLYELDDARSVQNIKIGENPRLRSDGRPSKLFDVRQVQTERLRVMALVAAVQELNRAVLSDNERIREEAYRLAGEHARTAAVPT